MLKKFHLPFEVLILVLVLASHAYVAFAPQNRLLNWYRTDDAFYYFKVAQNISEGRGITFDGLSFTNGFHPFWMLVCIPVFSLARFDLFLPLRVLVMVLALFNAATGILLYRLFASNLSRESGWLVSIFWMFHPAIHGLTTMLGMETGVNAFSIVLFFYLVSQLSGEKNTGKNRHSQLLWLGLSALLVLFSRLDNIFLVLLAGVWLVLRRSSLRWQVLRDFCLILLVVLVSYYLRIQTTTNLFNFLPFVFLLLALSLVLKPLALYFSGGYQLVLRPGKIQPFIKSALFLSMASLLTTGIVMLVYDVLHLFRGYSRAVIVLDALLSMVVLLAFHYLPLRFSTKKTIAIDEDISLKKNIKDWLQRALLYFAPLGAGLGIYMLFNRAYAGTALPISGTIKRWWGLLPNTVYGTPIKTLDGVLQGFFSPSPNAGPWSLLLQPLDGLARTMAQWFNPQVQQRLGSFLFIFLILLILGLAFWLVRRQSAWVVKTADRFGLLPLLAGCVFSILSYKATGYLHAKYWYWISEMVLLVLVGGILVECVFCEIRQRVKNSSLSVLLAKAACVFILVGFAFNIYYITRWDSGWTGRHPYLAETQEIEKNTQPGSVIGMTGGGVTAYFIHDRTVVNLDGLINGIEYYRQLKTGDADDYFSSIGLQYVIGAPSMLLDSDPYRWILEDHLIPLHQVGEITIYRYHQPVA